VPSPQGDRTFSIERVLVGDRNGARLPAYHRLDAAANHLWQIGDHGQTATLGLSVFNAYNRQNVWYREFTSVGGQILENNINLMGLTLNASFTVKF
jgi:ferric enterobactin receptor